MNNKGLGCFVIFLVLALVVSVIVNLLQVASHFGVDEASLGIVNQKPKFSELLEQSGAKESKDKIVQIDLEGVISGSHGGQMFSDEGLDVDGVKRALEQAVNDKDVKAIVLRVNSPGGEVTASDELYHAVKETAKVKKVIVYMDSIAASGGYYLSCGASKIVANETTLTGSIGVIIQTLNYKDAFGKLGLEQMTFASGAFKDTLGGARVMRDDEKAYVQALVTQMYEKFLGIVSEARGISKEVLKNGIADGRVFTGAEALQKKLVDKLGYIEDAYALAKELGQAPGATVVKYQRHTKLSDLFGALSKASTNSGKVRIDVSDRLLPRLEAGKMYLLPAHMIP